MRKVFLICIALSAIVLAGCDQQKLFDSFIPKDEAAIGQGYIEDIRARNFQPVIDKINPAYKSPALLSTLEKMASAFPPEKPKSIKVVGSNTVSSPERTMYNLTYEYEFSHKWALGHIYFGKSGNNIQIERMDVYPLKDSLEHFYAFTLAGKTPIHYVILLLAIILPIFMLVSAIACYRTPIPKRKWLWVIFIMLGFVAVSLNWTTGELGWNLLSFALLGATFTHQFYGPPIIQIAFPLGAVLFWSRRSRWMSMAANKEAARKGADMRSMSGGNKPLPL
jgi:hypothetical protein